MPLAIAKQIHRAFVQRPRTERLARALADLVGPAGSILDVGCGSGEVAARVAAITGARRVEGVDILVQPSAHVSVTAYDGTTLPYPGGAYDVVVLSDVLHHAESPARLLAEALRVASRAVVVKDHFAFGAASRRLLLAMDLAANGFYGIAVRGTYLDPAAWRALFHGAGARVDALSWPLVVHPAPLRLLAPSRLQFAARLERAA